MTSKRQKIEDDDIMEDSDEGEDVSDESGSDEEEIDKIDEEVQVDFEGRNPTDGDKDGIQQLLHQLLLSGKVNLVELTDIIVSQYYIGSVMKQVYDDNEAADDDDDDDDDTVFGITTALNLDTKNEVNRGSIEKLKTLIMEKAEKNATDKTLKMFKDTLANDKINTGFIINERYVNIPSQISVPMLENLCKEINRACEKNKPFNFAYYIMILKLHRIKANKGKPEQDIFSNPEEELFFKESLVNFEYSVENEIDMSEDDSGMTPIRKVVMIDGKKFPQIVSSINNFINGTD